MLRGKQLDEVIEQELQMMLIEGFEKSPISHKTLHNRLTAKGYISGGLSTLSSAERKKLISLYVSEQISPLNLKTKEQQLYPKSLQFAMSQSYSYKTHEKAL